MKTFEQRLNELRRTYEDFKSGQFENEKLETLSVLIEDALNLTSDVLSENDSVWELIEEQRKSEIENHATALQKELDHKVNEIFLLTKSKIVDA